ncbi:hypothetical protein B0H11DRAFT_1898087 [Mycena galericulata]|nr:hypothetical protein B0H11DRAFT_1898087 [Mycena galericulata]
MASSSSSSTSSSTPDAYSGDSAEDTDSEQEYVSDVEGSESDGSISSFSESELPDSSFETMPEHLTLPLELQHNILSQETSQFAIMWGTYRFVCKAWKEHVEYLAKTEWVRTGAFSYEGYMIRDPEEGKVLLKGFFEFVRMDGDTAIFQDECAPEFHKAFVTACKATSPPDVEVCGIVHDVKIPGMSVHWKTLTITCPWRALVGRLLAEELRVDAYRARTNRVMMTKVKRLRSAGLEKVEEAVHLFAAHVHGAYEAVRKARLGRTDRRGDERLKHARVAASWRLMAREEESGSGETSEESEDSSGGSEDSIEESERSGV